MTIVSEPTTAQPVLLDAYAAKRCVRRVHNEADPALEQVPWEPPPDLQAIFDAANAYEDDIVAELEAALPATSWIDLRDGGGRTEAIAATVRAMADRVDLVIGGWLPDDPAGGRKGRPDLLLHVGDGRYVPGDVKAHKMIGTSVKGTLTCSVPSAPGDVLTVAGLAAEKSKRRDDYLQLAHYWRMLEAIDRAAAGGACGFVIGTDVRTELSGSGHVLTWLDLDAPLFETYSRSEGRKKRSALERYDHELGFRLKVAAAARAGEEALVEPIFTDECRTCPWYDRCLDIADPDDASAAITAGRLSVREWRALGGLGIHTVHQLAALDPAEPAFWESYSAEVTHVAAPDKRLATAVRRARMVRDGLVLEREADGPVDMPRADVEIDFDIEWDPDTRVYLWGALVTRAGGAPAYESFVSWAPALDDGAERALADSFAVWLRGEIASADAAGKSLRVYHYADVEPKHLERVLGKDAVADLTDRFVDLLPIMRAHFFAVAGHSIKKIAPAFGFAWRDDDPGGLQSQAWLVEARSAASDDDRASARRRILEYNEDDVRATAAIRNGL
jgi:predicted RecB family nuclease